jgi:hypothetical protein
LKRLLLIALFYWAPVQAQAAPFIVTDILAAGVSQCGVFMDAAPKVTIPVTAVTGGNICKHDVGAVSPGAHSATMTAISVNDPIWGSQESPQSLPFTFTKPAVPAAPTGLKLAP